MKKCIAIYFGGNYSENDIDYYEVGKIPLWIDIKCYRIKVWCISKYYSFRIAWLKFRIDNKL